ncbi:MAG: hypothetical protein AAFX87_18700 [Bacteroidota bacterium]
MSTQYSISALEPATKEEANKGEVYTCWHKFVKWDESRVNSIVDGAGANVNRQITSYPSPIARIHLFNDAFEFYNNHSNLDGETIHTQLISHCLDIWEILFYHDLFREKVKYKYWSFLTIDDLQTSSYEGHHLLADSLDLFIRKDKNPSLKAIKGIYLVSYDGQIIAGSSPFTGFFSAPQLGKIEISVPGKPDQKYFRTIRHLNERGIEFQKYMHILMRTKDVVQHFRGFYEYVRSFNNSSPTIQDIWANEDHIIDSLRETLENNYEVVRDPDTLKLLDASQEGGFEIRSFRPKVEEDCYFTIQSSLWKKGKVLALKTRPEGPGNKPYVTGRVWDDGITVPIYIDEPNLNLRKLPGVNIEFPFITVGDFFEDYLIKLPYDINDEAFLSCTPDGGDSPFLLPLRPLAFQFFSIEEIRKKFSLSFSKNSLKIRVKAKLTLPLTNNQQITFIKEYDTVEDAFDIPTPGDIRKAGDNRGYVLNDYRFGIWIYPFVKTNQKEFDNFYRVGCVDSDFSNPGMAVLTFYQNGRPIQAGANASNSSVVRKTRVKKESGKDGSEYYAIQDIAFDTIGVQINTSGIPVSAMIVPDWSKQTIKVGEQNKYAFAVDFGTTNTHVAYRKNSGEPKAFDIGASDIPIARLDKIHNVDPGVTLTDQYDRSWTHAIIRNVTKRQRHEFIPSVLGEKYRFPLRTAISQASSIDTIGELLLLANANISFGFNQSFNDNIEERIFTNLKWKAEDFDKERIKAFIGQLLMMIRTKVLLNKANPSKTRLYWFVPLSMSESMTSRLKEIWVESFQRIFNTSHEPVLMTESEAPFHKMQVEGTFTGKTSLTIDIGGGTTDALIFHQDKVQLATSFSFAGSAVFGDFNLANNRNNGIVRYFKPLVLQRINEMRDEAGEDQQEIIRIEEIKKTFDWYFDGDNDMYSDDVASFFFSRPDFRFAEGLKDAEDFKFVFILFFVALHYHCATIFKTKGFPAPNDISLSGNGSRIVNLITSSRKNLQDLIRAIYRNVLGDDIPNIALHIPKEPKEITCYGALYLDEEPPTDFSDKTYKHLGETLKWKDDQEPKKIMFKDLKEAAFDLSSSEFIKFHELFFQLYEDEKFSEKFGVKISNLESIKKFMLDNAEGNFEKGLVYQAKRGVTENEELRETVFFYAITGSIYDLLNEFTKKREGKETAIQ